MNKTDFTNEQKLAINCTHDKETSGTICVSAAAGSGKTSVITERVIKMIATDHVDATKLLVVTFTTAAAEEMRARIKKELDSLITSNSNETAYLKQQKLLLSKVNICTIDSFCRRLVSEHFEEANIHPDMKIITEIQKRSYKKQAFDNIFAWCNETVTNFQSLLEIIGGDNKFQQGIETISGFFDSIPFADDWINKTMRFYEDESIENNVYAKIIFDNVKNRISKHRKIFDSILKSITDDKAYEKFAEAYNNGLLSITEIEKAVNSKDWEACRFSLENSLKQWIPCRFAQAKNRDTNTVNYISCCYKNCKADLDDFITIFSRKVQKDISDYKSTTKTLLEISYKYFEEYNLIKQAHGVVDFSDIEHAALNILVNHKDDVCKPTETAKEITNNLFEVLVDEYQDTNDLQNAIFNALSDGGKKLFVVGDIKQSIYGFRMADPDIFQKLLNSNNTDNPNNTIVNLSTNFRSRPEICDAVNYIFSLLLTGDKTEIKYDDNHKLVSGGTFYEQNEIPKCNCTIIDGNEKDEFNYIANEILSLVGKKIISDKNRLRTATFSDIAILLRSPEKNSDELVKTLKRNGINSVYEKKTDVFSLPDVKKLLSMLKLINDPYDDVSFTAVMISPMFGFTPEEIAKLRIAHRDMPLYGAASLEAESNKSINDFLSKIEQFRKESVFLTPGEIIDKVLNETAFSAYVSGFNSPERLDGIESFREIATDYQNTGYRGLSGFLRYVENVEKDENNSLKIQQKNASLQDAVRIMSIHHSKGLQFPIVFCSCLDRNFNMTDVRSSVILDRNIGIGINFINDRKQRINTIMHMATSLRKKENTIAEELRLLYVATTRAIDMLYLTMSYKKLELKKIIKYIDNTSINSDVLMSASALGYPIIACMLLHPNGSNIRSTLEYNCATTVTDSRFTISTISAEEITKPESIQIEDILEPTINNEEADSLADKISKRLSYKYPYEGLNSIAAKYTVSQIAKTSYSDEPTLNIPSFIDSSANYTEKGTAIHLLLQFISLGLKSEDTSNELNRLFAEGKLPENYRQYINENEIKRFIESNLYKRMSNSKVVNREWRFIFDIPVERLSPELQTLKTNDKAVIQGIIDCAFEENGNYVLVDYKTAKHTEKLKDNYNNQLNIYAEAIEKIYNIKVSEKILYAVSTGEEILL